MYDIADNGLNWLVKDKINTEKVKGIVLGNGKQVCIDKFANDTNDLVENDERSIFQFLECVHIYCKASRLVINHSKTSIKTLIQEPS